MGAKPKWSGPERDEPWVYWLIALSAAAVAAAIVVARSIGALQGPELAAYDAALDWRADRHSPSRVAVVVVDDYDLGSWGWPLSDGRLADIGNAALAAGASLVGLDIYRDQPIGEGGAALASLLADTRIVGISKLASQRGPGIRPAAALKNGNRFGFSDLVVDGDGTVRRGLLLVNGKDGVELSFALRLAQMAQSPPAGAQLKAASNDPHTLQIGATSLPRLDRAAGYSSLDSQGYQFLIDYHRHLGSIAVIPARRVSDAAVRDALNNKIVLIGTVSDAIKDFFQTPYPAATASPQTPGVLVHAAILDQLLALQDGARRPTGSLPRWLESLIILVLTAGGAAAAYFSTGAVRLMAFGPLAAMAIFLAASFQLQTDLWLPSVAFTLAWLGAFIVAIAELEMAARYRQRLLARLFSVHVSPALAAQIWDNRQSFLAGGRPKPLRLEVTVLFVDLSGSTRAGGTMQPDQFAAWVGRFLDRMTEIASNSGAVIEKLTGDGVMAIFGAPVPRATEAERDRDACNACDCALAMAESVDSLNRSGTAEATYRFRIGIDSGGVLGGSFGGASRRQYSVIGDAANIAARLQAFGKSLADPEQPGGPICVSGAAAARAGSGFEFREAGSLAHDDGTHEIAVLLLVRRATKAFVQVGEHVMT